LKNKNKDFLQWALWLTLVIIWNYGYPNALPISDVIVAVILSILLILFKKYK
tara:strand:+ start:951 stop:1106 length:156 start_codon:yes stop_codon:yes gene_type:complete